MPESQFNRMRAGEHYHSPDRDILERQARATEAYMAINATEGTGRFEERRELARKAMGAFGESFIVPPIRWEFGNHIFVGDGCLINTDCLFMDGADVVIGDFTLVAPGCKFVTAGHPVMPEERMVVDADTGRLDHAVCINKPITVGRNCWIGAGAIILGGVTIGDGTTVGAGSVVTRSLPERVVAAGNPARILRKLPTSDQD